jgi:hypothetical protein
MVKGTEETVGRHRRKLFQPLDDHHLAITDIDARGKYPETV